MITGLVMMISLTKFNQNMLKSLAKIFFILFFISSCVPANFEIDEDAKKTLAKIDSKIDTNGSDVLKPAGQGTIEEEIEQLIKKENVILNTKAIEEKKVTPPKKPSKKQNEVLSLDLKKLRNTVLRRNLGIEVIEQNLDIANEDLNSEKAKFDALFTNKIEYFNADLPRGNSTVFDISSTNSLLSGNSGVFTEADIDREQFKTSTGIDFFNPLGGVFSISQDFEIDDKTTSDLRSNEDRAGLSLSLSQPLLRGAGRDVNTASIQLSQYNLGIVDAEIKLASIRVLANAEKSYWNLYGALRILDIAKEQYKLAAENLEAIRTRIKLGDVAPVERFAAELSFAQQLDALINSNTEVKLKRRKLALFLNSPLLPIDSSKEVSIDTKPKILRYNLVREELIEKALDERLELLSLDLSIASAETEVRVAENKILPYFTLDFEYGTSDRDSSIGNSFTDSFRFDHQGFRAGSTFSVPLTNKAARANLRQKRAKSRQKAIKKEEQRLKIKQEVYDAADALEREWQRILAARQNVVSASANYNAEKSLFVEGQRNAQDVLISLQQLGIAREKEVKTIVAYQSDQIDLAFATGVVLGYGGFEVK